MNRADVLRMAEEAGLEWHMGLGGYFVKDPSLSGVDVLMRFADLLIADDRAARIATQTENEALKARLAASGVAERQAVRDAVLAEREACALVAESGFRYALSGYEIADNIRAQGAA